MSINWIDVESSNLAAVGYTPESETERATLHVRFKNGGEYNYLDVPQEHFDGLVGASSVGQYLNQQIKPSYQFEKVA